MRQFIEVEYEGEREAIDIHDIDNIRAIGETGAMIYMQSGNQWLIDESFTHLLERINNLSTPISAYDIEQYNQDMAAVDRIHYGKSFTQSHMEIKDAHKKLDELVDALVKLKGTVPDSALQFVHDNFNILRAILSDAESS